MVICSCNIISTEEIKNVINSMEEPTVKKVVKEIGWQSNCATCVNNLVTEIENIMEKSNEL